jgi:2-oxoglutarate dehydrogenase E1 component
VHPKLDRALQRRRVAFDRPDAPVDWAHAESLALAAVLCDGIPVRLTGQDAIRGTFSQRHLSFFDARTGKPFTPLAALPTARASFEVQNSPLSETAALGFEYGYSVQAPEALVLWEAQYGDFINGAQVIVDEFVVSGQAKWGLVSGLVLLLPHAWEGQGPDHSGARLERFLELAAEDNIRVANCTTAAQYFWLLRRQAASLGPQSRPLIVLTPKSLLRHPLAASRSSDLVESRFEPLLDDVRAHAHPRRVRRLVLCSGHIWVELESDPRRADSAAVAVLRVEELFPFPADEIADALERYQDVQDVIWLQEEPRNMGAWPFVEPRLRKLLGDRFELRYVGRPERASPAEGWAEAHAAEQRRIISEILEGVASHAR